MTVQEIPRPDYVGVEVDAGDAERSLRLLRLFLRDGETVLALATTVKALPTLTHIAVTDRRILGFSAAELAKEGPRQETSLTTVRGVETRMSYKQRWFFVVTDSAGTETDFGDVHDQDAPRLARIVQDLVRPAPPAAAPTPLAAPGAPTPPPVAPVMAPQWTAAAPALPQPAEWRYNPPPTWPAPPAGWTPPAGWMPDPGWPPAPPGWQFWTPAAPLPPVQTAPPLPAPHAPAPPTAAPHVTPAGSRGKPAFGARKQRIEELEAENAELRRWLERLGGLDAPQVGAEIERLRSEAAEAQRKRRDLRAELRRLRGSIVETEDLALLQEAGVYEYQHPLADVVAYKAELAKVKDQIKSMARTGKAVVGATNWTVNGSAAQGGKMVRDFSKLMLRAYNAEADNLVRTMRPYKLQSAIERLDKSAQTIERLGKTMDIKVSRAYRTVRVKELRLTADHLAKAEEEKERVRAERERQREEDKARKEFEREKARLLKERSHVAAALARLEANGDAGGVADLRAKLADVETAISDVEGRAANVRAGYVYVISNIGAFGERMVKIGMTRRLEPMDRVRELGDASVPFRFDVHALIFSNDAVGLEGRLHQEFAEHRVNQVNLRREFFYATPAEVREALERLAGNHLLEYNEVPEALEYRAGRKG
ncbi:DUF4041 domain-containing protein [Actinomadura violacea]|uniref:DUF4041 domain-containing protein n=1 Tax=Actinomadura violacea TaxID=2819934 RepID=A0ABS3RM82_9ACTN|nr:DUF4041 domain-containing protein [Actinomadura violacea]MBO2457811.1 DUF4041 domain-containing protein [Actinomadura violacea]